MVNLSDFDQSVAEFMADYGGPATLLITGPIVRDVESGDSVASVTEYAVKAILLDLTLQSNGLQTVNGKLISSADKMAFIQPINKSNPNLVMPSIDPNKDKFRAGGITYSIITLKETNPSTDNNVLYELYLKR